MEDEDFISNGYKEVEDELSLNDIEKFFRKEFLNEFGKINYYIKIEKDKINNYHAEGVFRFRNEYFSVNYNSLDWKINDMEKFMARVFNCMNCDAWGGN